MDQRVQQTITKYIGDLHALESHGLQAIGRQSEQLKDANHPEALSAVNDAKQTLEKQVSTLENRLNALGGSPTGPVKEAASAIAGVVAGIYNAVRNEEASKSVRDTYTFLSLTSMAYMMLMTSARSLGDKETEELAEDGYRDTARLLMLIDRIMPKLVVQELQQDGLSAQDVSSWADQLVHSAWTRQGSTAGVTGSVSGSL